MIKMLVDTAVTVPVNIAPLLDDTDFKTRETGVAYNAAGMDLVWNFITKAGVITQTAVTPTTGGDYDWSEIGDAMYKIEIPASGGASINNDTEGFGWFSGVITGILPFRGPTIHFAPANVINSLVDGSDYLQVDTIQIEGTDATDQLLAALQTYNLDHLISVTGTVDTGVTTPTTTMFGTTLAKGDDFYNDNLIIFTSGTLAGQSKVITLYENGGDITLDEALTAIPSHGDAFVIVSLHLHTIKQITDGVLDAPLSEHQIASTVGAALNQAILVVTSYITNAVQVAIENNNLDHLLKVAALSADIVDDTVIAQIVSAAGTADWDSFENNNHSLEALGDIVSAIKGLTDTLNVTSGNVHADVKAINASTTAAQRLALTAARMIPFTVDNTAEAPTTTTFEADDITEATADHYNGRIILWTSGALEGQVCQITDYLLNGGRGAFTVSTLTEAPANNDTGIII